MILCFADEEKEDIETFSGNLPVGHHRYDTTNTAGNGGDRMCQSGLSCISEQALRESGPGLSYPQVKLNDDALALILTYGAGFGFVAVCLEGFCLTDCFNVMLDQSATCRPKSSE